MLNSRPKGCWFEPHWHQCIVSLRKNINPSLVLVQPRKTRPYITERLLMGRKESNKQTNKTKLLFSIGFFNESPMITSYDTNAQVHRTFDLWKKHDGKCDYVRIPERLFDIFLLFLGLICQRWSSKLGNISFDLVMLLLLSKSPMDA